MRIAIYHNLLSGGAKRALHEEVIRLSPEHEIDVYTLSSANHQFADLRAYVDNHHIYNFTPLPLMKSPFGRLNQAIRLVDLLRLRRINRKIARDINMKGYDVCYVNPCQYETSPSLLRYLNGLPSVYFCQEPLRRLYEEHPGRPYDESDSAFRRTVDRIDPLIASYHSVLKQTDRSNLLSADEVLVNSQFVQHAVNKIYNRDPVVCYLGIDNEWFTPTQEKKGDFVLSVGSLTPLKGFDFLIEALSLIPEESRPLLVIASNFQNPPEKAYLEELAQSCGVDLVLEGNVDEERLLQLYNQARITVYAAIREPFGLVPVESMACGTPVVAVRDGGVQETVLDGKTGYLVQRDPEEFANAVQHLLSNPDLAEDFGRNGIDHVRQNWTWENAISTLEEQFKKVRIDSHVN